MSISGHGNVDFISKSAKKALQSNQAVRVLQIVFRASLFGEVTVRVREGEHFDQKVLLGLVTRDRRDAIKVLSAMRRTLAIVLAFVGVVASGCSDPTDPPSVVVGEAVLTSAGEKNQLWTIAPTSGTVVSRLDFQGKVQSMAASADGATLYAGLAGSNFRNELTAVDTHRNAVLWRLPLGDNGQPNVVDGIGLISGEALAVSPDGRKLYLWRAIKDGITGITVIDLETRRPLSFSGPWNIAGRGLVPLPSSTLEWGGDLAIVASRQNAAGGSLGQTSVFLLEPLSLQAIDSILPRDLGGSPSEDIWRIVPAPDGQSIYIEGNERLLRYSIAERRVTASVQRPSTGALSLIGDGATVLVSDAGTWPDSPGSGLLYLYGPNFEPRGNIDLSTPLGGNPRSSTATVMEVATASPDGRTVYVRTGSPAIGSLYPPQPARVLVVDILDQSLKRTVELREFGSGFLAVRRD